MNCGTVNNSYSLDTTSTKGVGSIDTTAIETEFEIKTQSQMQEQDFLILLGTDNWKLDSEKNTGYPILNWE